MPATLRVVTWNLYHGRSEHPADRSLLREFSAALGGWEWDVALLQEVPPWWPPELARAAGAAHRTCLTSRNSLLAVRRAIAERWPDAIRSNGGGANAILARHAINVHATRRLRLRPERRYLHAVRLRDAGLWVANAHTSVRSADPEAGDVELARRVALRWAGDRPLVLGGDLNHRDLRLDGLAHAAGRGLTKGIDYVWARGLTPVGEPEVLDAGALSDHRPIAAVLAHGA